MKILQINTVVSFGSTGKITQDIGEAIVNEGWESYIGYGRGNFLKCNSKLIKIGNSSDLYINALATRFFDNHGFGLKSSTIEFIDFIDKLNLDLIHLHNLHGYYLNIEVLFTYIRERRIPVLWTLHDCWSFTGHCTHYTFENCDKWKSKCFSCPQISQYPKSLFLDRSEINFFKKKKLFNSLNDLTIVPVSNWLSDQVKESFLSSNDVNVIKNGIDVTKFDLVNLTDKSSMFSAFEGKKIILGVSNIWSDRKGILDFFELRKLLTDNYVIVLIGLNKNQIRNLPKGIVGIQKTNSLEELVNWYNFSDVFFNPTWEDTYPTVNLEAIACGLPIITYNSGGSPESVSDTTGFVVEKGDFSSVVNYIKILTIQDRFDLKKRCRKYAVEFFDKNKLFNNYISLYKKILKL